MFQSLFMKSRRIIFHVMYNELAQLAGIIKSATIRQLVLAFKFIWKHTLKDNSTFIAEQQFH